MSLVLIGERGSSNDRVLRRFSTDWRQLYQERNLFVYWWVGFMQDGSSSSWKMDGIQFLSTVGYFLSAAAGVLVMTDGWAIDSSRSPIFPCNCWDRSFSSGATLISYGKNTNRLWNRGLGRWEATALPTGNLHSPKLWLGIWNQHGGHSHKGSRPRQCGQSRWVNKN